jgi:hypothetical protein
MIKLANWEFWANMKEVKLIDAVLLSLDIEPRSIPQTYRSPLTPRITIRGCPELSEKIDTALNHYRKYALERHDLNQRVSLSEFRAWAEGLSNPWKLPEQFPRSPIPANSLGIDDSADPCVACIDGSTTVVANTHTKTWKTDALQIAQEVLERDRKADRHPTLTDLANSVAKLMRERGITNSRNQPPSAKTILRHVFTAEWREKFGFKAKRKA